MNTEVGKAVADVLDVLAAKFGTTAAYLWGVMVKQQVVWGWWALGLALVCLTLCVVVGRIAFLATEKDAASDNERSKEDALGFRVLAVVFLTVAAMVSAGWFGYSAITSIANPEYAALKEVLSLIK